MWEGFIVTTICTGWLCKAIHGEEYRHPLKGTFKTEESCRSHGELVLSLSAGRLAVIDPNLNPRVECIKNG
jgi:hypothetical protein